MTTAHPYDQFLEHQRRCPRCRQAGVDLTAMCSIGQRLTKRWQEMERQEVREKVTP